jgi:hypothetical protein
MDARGVLFWNRVDVIKGLLNRHLIDVYLCVLQNMLIINGWVKNIRRRDRLPRLSFLVAFSVPGRACPDSTKPNCTSESSCTSWSILNQWTLLFPEQTGRCSSLINFQIWYLWLFYRVKYLHCPFRSPRLSWFIRHPRLFLLWLNEHALKPILCVTPGGLCSMPHSVIKWSQHDMIAGILTAHRIGFINSQPR